MASRILTRSFLLLATSLTFLVSPLFSSPPLISHPPIITPRHSPRPPSPRACPGLASGAPRACLQQGVASSVFRVFGGQVWLARLQSLEHAPSTPRGRSTPWFPTLVQDGPGGLNNRLVINNFLFITTHVCSRTKRLPRLEHALSLP